MPRLRTTSVLVTLAATSASLQAQVSPVVHEVLKTGTEWVGGIAEPASGRFIVYADEHAIKIYNRQSHQTASVPVQIRSRVANELSISRSGNRIVFPAADDAKSMEYVWALDLDTLTGKPTSEPRRVSAVPSMQPEISPDGHWIAFATEERNAAGRHQGNRLVVMPSDGGDERMLDSAARVQTPKWTHDGKTIFYIRGRGKGPGLARVAVSGGTPDSLSPAEGVIGVSADDRLVATMVNFRSSQASLQITDANGRKVGGFQFNAEDDRPYAWSAFDPTRLLFFRRLEPSTLKTVSIADGSVKNYPIREVYPSHPRFSPSGSRLAVVGKVDGRDQFIVFEAKSGQRRVLQTPTQPERSGWSWSPDGSRIAFLTTNGSTLHHEIHVVDVLTSRSARLTELNAAFPSNATLYHWRSDSKTIDYVVVTPVGPPAEVRAELRRVDLAGTSSLIRALPDAQEGTGTTGGYRLVNDTILVVGEDCGGPCKGTERLMTVPIPRGDARPLSAHAGYWLLGLNSEIGSPDGNWIALGAIGKMDGRNRPQWGISSLDGKTFRLLGEPMGCDVWPVQWLPDSRSLIGIGASSCSDWHEDLYQLPIDGSAARHIPLPDNEGFTLTPDGKSVLVAVDDPKQGSIVAYDLAKIVSVRP